MNKISESEARRQVIVEASRPRRRGFLERHSDEIWTLAFLFIVGGIIGTALILWQ